MHRTLPPIELDGKCFLNLARTTPLGPCERVTLPQIVRNAVPCFFVFALYT